MQPRERGDSDINSDIWRPKEERVTKGGKNQSKAKLCRNKAKKNQGREEFDGHLLGPPQYGGKGKGPGRQHCKVSKKGCKAKSDSVKVRRKKV